MFRDYSDLISRFQANPANALLYYLILIIAILISLILHENAHGLVALWCGDPTAKMLGRLSLNPAKHLDPIGTISMILFRFGWAKPVPIDSRNFRHYRRDFIFVSLAGIAMNLILFLTCMAISIPLNQVLWNDALPASIKPIEMYDAPYFAVYTGVFDTSSFFKGNLTLFPEAITGFMRAPALMYLQFFLQAMASVNLSLAIFNLLPIPPLDGFRLIQGASNGRVRITPQAMQIIQIVTIVLLFTGVISRILNYIYSPVYQGTFSLLLKIFGLR